MSQTTTIAPLRVPYEDNAGLREMDSRTAELMQGCIEIVGEINTTTAMQTISSLRFLAEKRQNVKILLNSHGGEITAGLAIIDAIRSYPYEVSILCVAMAASMGALILASCPKGNRFIMPHGKVMIHEPLIAGGLGGSVTTIEKTARSMIETRNIVNGLLAECTGKSIEEINEATAFDNFMSAQEAIAFGICDAISTPYL